MWCCSLTLWHTPPQRHTNDPEALSTLSSVRLPVVRALCGGRIRRSCPVQSLGGWGASNQKKTLSWQRVRSIPVLATLCPRAQSAAWNNRSAASPCSQLNVLSLESLRAAPLPAQGRPCLAYTAPSTKCQCLHRERCVDKTLVNNAAVW